MQSDSIASPEPYVPAVLANTKKKRKKKGKHKRKRSASTATPQVHLLPIKRNIPNENREPSKFQRLLAGSSEVQPERLREQVLELKNQEKIDEEQICYQLREQLEFLITPDLNLFDWNPETDSEPSSPVKKQKKRQRLPKKVEEIYSSELVSESESESESNASVSIVESQPIEELSIRIPHINDIVLPDVLDNSTIPTPESLLQAEKDAVSIQNVLQLQKKGLWAPKRIPRIPDPPRAKSHWDYMLAEMVWMANDFKQERKMKMAHAKKIVRAIVRKRKESVALEIRKEKEEKAEIRYVASFIAREVSDFWSKIEVLVKHKHEVKLEEKVQEARGQQLEFLVGQTERYSNKLAADLRSPLPLPSEKSQKNNTKISDQSKVPIPFNLEAEDEKMTDPELDESMDMEEPPKIHVEGNQEERKEIIDRAAENATKHQPTGTTFSTTEIKTKIPDLLRGTLREYQHIGLDWLVSMYDAKLNGILADEMGLGKTIMTISLLAYLANEYGIWGPHLIVVPTSVMLNWERELKRFAPGLKVLTYFGSQKERKQKRNGWSKPNAFHVCITSYNLVSQDKIMLNRKKWVYLILDEAQNIKNFRSQRWQVLLNFNTRRRLLLTGTPLQNNLMELWSLMHFLMPHIFQSHSDFKEWFCKPVNSMIEGATSMNEQLIARLHGVLRPFILRRLKKDVEKQLPGKFEHIVPCSLSKRQRFLYDEFMSRGKTKDSLASGNYLSVLNVLMQLRKVCNHPDLFEERSISSPFRSAPLTYYTPPHIWKVDQSPLVTSQKLTNHFLFPPFLHQEERMNSAAGHPKDVERLLSSPQALLKVRHQQTNDKSLPSRRSIFSQHPQLRTFHNKATEQKKNEDLSLLEHACYLNQIRSAKKPLYGYSLRSSVQAPLPTQKITKQSTVPSQYLEFSDSILSLSLTHSQRLQKHIPVLDRFCCYIPPVSAPPMSIRASSNIESSLASARNPPCSLSPSQCTILHATLKHKQLALPEKRLVQFDCGKLQKLALLLRNLKAGHHRVLIFTQMTRMLDILEIFLNLHGYTYMRLDGATKPEQRQASMERFNADDRVFAFILSTRSGGCGINLIGADTVVFYDSDWNPAMDAQAQDRCHRIGQTREVHIYRLISSQTIEENILKKANQKRLLDQVAIGGGQFTTDFFQNVDLHTFVDATKPSNAVSKEQLEKAMNELEDESDVLAMKRAQSELNADFSEFDDDPSNLPDDADTEYIKSQLNSIQRYAYRFLEEVEPVVDTEEMEELHVMVADRAQQWKRDTLKRIKDTEHTMDSNERLYYEVASPTYDAVKEYMSEDMIMFCPPLPPPTPSDQSSDLPPIHLYIHPFDYDPFTFSESVFSEYIDLFNWTQETVKERFSLSTSKAPGEKRSTTLEKKRKRSESIDKTSDQPEKKRSKRADRSQSRSSLPKPSPGSNDNLFSYKLRKVTIPKTRRKTPEENALVTVPFSSQEDELLLHVLECFGPNWYLIADILNHKRLSVGQRTAPQCIYHYQIHLAPKSTVKSRKKSPAVPIPELEYLPGFFDRAKEIDSLLQFVLKLVPQPSGAVTRDPPAGQPDPSHLKIMNSLGVCEKITPAKAIQAICALPPRIPEPPIAMQGPRYVPVPSSSIHYHNRPPPAYQRGIGPGPPGQGRGRGFSHFPRQTSHPVPPQVPTIPHVPYPQK